MMILDKCIHDLHKTSDYEKTGWEIVACYKCKREWVDINKPKEFAAQNHRKAYETT